MEAIIESDSYELFIIAMAGVSKLESAYKLISEKGKIEVLILNSLLILQKYNENFPDKYEKNMEGYFMLLFRQAMDYGITTSSTEELSIFINSRLEFYFNEFANVENNIDYVQSRIYNNFYINPLIEIPKEFNDLEEFVKFLPGYQEMLKFIVSKTEIFFQVIRF
jgi:hypothetical protein